MNDSAIFSLIALGGAAIFGLQGALSLAVRHHQVRNQNPFSACNKVALSKEAQVAKIPIAYGAVIFYGFVLVQLLRGIYFEEINLYLLKLAIRFQRSIRKHGKSCLPVGVNGKSF